MTGIGKRDLILPKLKKVIVDIGLVHFPIIASSILDFGEKMK